jgi:hypothetical protein
MDYDKYVFLDYKNIRDIDIDSIDEKVKMVIIVDGNTNRIPVDLIKKTQPFGNSIEWLQIKDNGNKNALHFFVAYFLGCYISNRDKKEFIIYSGNKSCDPLIEYLQNKNIDVKRVANFRQICESAETGFLRDPSRHVLALWGKLAVIQKIIFAGIILMVISGFAALFAIPLTPALVPVISSPIRNEAALGRIVLRIGQEGVKVKVTPDRIVLVPDEATARRMRAILIREDLIPPGTDPWNIFDRDRWAIADLERNASFRQSHVRMITDHIRAIEDIDDASVIVIWPERKLFQSEQEPVSASVAITLKPGSDMAENRAKIEGIQKMLKLAIGGLEDEHIVIADRNGTVLNGFETYAPILDYKDGEWIQPVWN